jgi:hypothetical protein
MPIRTTAAPVEFTAELRRGFGVMRGEAGATAEVPLAQPRRAGLLPGLTHRIFSLGLKDIAEGGDILGRARLVAWRYLLSDGGGHEALAAEVYVTDGRQQFAGLNEGPFSTGLIQAIAAADALPAVRDGDFELNLLRVPALWLVALWLKSGRPGMADLLVPMAPAPPGLNPNRPYAADQLFAVMAPTVRQKLAKPSDRN